MLMIGYCISTTEDFIIGNTVERRYSSHTWDLQKVAGLVGWVDLRETSLIHPHYDMAELAGLASFKF